MNPENTAGMTTCVTCGKQYKVCRTCQNGKDKFYSWRLTACCPVCYQISEIIHSHFYNKISDNEAYDSLERIGWRDINDLTPVTHEYIEKIVKSIDEVENKNKKDPIKKKFLQK